MVTSSQRTIYGTQLALCKLTGANYHVKANTTLNEKYGILDDEVDIYLRNDNYPYLKYMGIGIGGSDTITDIEGFTYSKHSAIDGAPFQQIPFVLRLRHLDLTPEERAQYRFRKTMYINNIEYVAYYLKVLDDISVHGELYNVSRLGEEQTLSLFSTSNDKILNPVPVDKSHLLNDVLNSEYVTALCKVKVNFEQTDLERLEEVFKILGYATPANITEIVLCTGIETTSNEPDTGSEYLEAKCVQVNYHIGMDLEMSTLIPEGKPVRRNIEIGGSEPYYYKN